MKGSLGVRSLFLGAMLRLGRLNGLSVFIRTWRVLFYKRKCKLYSLIFLDEGNRQANGWT